MPLRRRPKEQVTLRIDAELLATYQALGRGYGRGYQSVMEDVLREAINGSRQPEIRVPWTYAHDNFLRQYYRKRGAPSCAVKLRRSVRSIHHRASFLGLLGRGRASNKQKSSQTDWARVDAMRDEDIDLSDNPEVTPEMFARAKIRHGASS